MSKQGEIDYLKNISVEARQHAFDKPYSDPKCGGYLCDVGMILSLLPSPPARVLDLGAGTGWTSVFFARRGYQVVGQDIEPDMVAMALQNRKRYGLDDLSFVVADYEDMKFEDEFDAAIFYDSLHHAVDDRKALHCAHRALKRGGVCITVEPGSGHSESEDAITAMRELGVTERDMPPRRIISIGRDVGFSHFSIFLRSTGPSELNEDTPIIHLTAMLRAINRRILNRPFDRDLETNIVVLTK